MDFSLSESQLPDRLEIVAVQGCGTTSECCLNYEAVPKRQVVQLRGFNGAEDDQDRFATVESLERSRTERFACSVWLEVRAECA
jgi:hypothetical protein